LESLSNTAVRNYRAPSFSITHRAKWAWEVLAELGFQVDSSLCPARHGSDESIPPGLHRISTPAGDLWQFPISVKRYGRFRLPISGGGYFRLLPLNWNIRQLQNVNRSGDPFVFYIHPWEIDPDQPRIRGGKFSSRWRHYVRLNKTYGKLERLLDSFQFSTVASLVEKAAA
jgi:polysaccharide deacetylase family protein (PEP-CTERM system associated)